MKLDESDYENIFLRVRDKLYIQFIAICAVIFGIVGFTTWHSVKTRIDGKIESAVNEYIQSKEFKEVVIKSSQEKLAELDRHANQIENLLSRQQLKIAQQSEIPIIIDEKGLTLVNKNGQQFHIEMGNAKSGEDSHFQNTL